MMIGTVLEARRRLQTSSPSSFGSIRSRTTRSTCCSANRSSASSPSRAWTTREAVPLERDTPGASERSPRRRRAGWWRSRASAAPAGARRSSSYYSQGMAALPPRYARRRPRRGSLERPVNGRLYRGTWLLVGAPAAHRRLQRAHGRAAAGRRVAAAVLRPGRGARGWRPSWPRVYPDRMPGTAGALGAAAFVREQLQPYGLQVEPDRFSARAPGPRRVQTLENQVVTCPGRSPDEIVVMAHRDNDGSRPGRQRQRLRHRDPDPARALVRLDPSERAPVQPDAHARLRLHRRRSVRRRSARSGSPSGTGGGVVAAIDLTALAGRGRTAARARRHRAAARLAGARRDRVSARRSSRPAAGRRTPALWAS